MRMRKYARCSSADCGGRRVEQGLDLFTRRSTAWHMSSQGGNLGRREEALPYGVCTGAGASTNEVCTGGAEIDQPLPNVSVSIYILDQKGHHRGIVEFKSWQTVSHSLAIHPDICQPFASICVLSFFLRNGFWRDGTLSTWRRMIEIVRCNSLSWTSGRRFRR